MSRGCGMARRPVCSFAVGGSGAMSGLMCNRRMS